MNDLLKTATTIVGLLAGVVAAVYMLGGAVIALRLLFDHASLQGVVTAVGQLPRGIVIATALLNVIGPAVAVGLFAAVGYGLAGHPNRSGSGDGGEDDLDKGSRRHRLSVLAAILVIAVGSAIPGFIQAVKTDGFSPLLLTAVYGIAITAGVAAAGWFLIRRAGRRPWGRIGRALAAGAIWAAIAVTPMTMLASAKPFEQARVCTKAAVAPLEGRLIGQSSERLLLEEHFNKEAEIVAVPSSEITESEFGDVSSSFSCPTAPGTEASAEVAEAALGGHGSTEERTLAAELRPRLRFDSKEPWRPLSVAGFAAEQYVDGSDDEVCASGSQKRCEVLSSLAALKRGAGAPGYIDIHGEGRNGVDYKSPYRRCRGSVAVDCNQGRLAVIYYRRTSHDGHWYWDYWWFLRYNDYIGRINECAVYCADHEGDWEGMTVITTPSLEPQILGAIYAAHRARILVDASILPLSGTHPEAFVAEGTHATYPYSCSERCGQYDDAFGVPLPEDRHDGEVAWGGNDDAECARYECVQPLPEVGHPGDTALPLAGEWAGWSGKWGSTCVEGCSAGESSPASPGLQIRYQCPWAPTRVGQLTTAGKVTKSEPVGDAERLRATCQAQRGG